jgi:hypothetical protein
MKNETDILIEIAELEVELAREMREDILHDINILKIRTAIATLQWVLGVEKYFHKLLEL